MKNRLKTKSIWPAPKERFYRFLDRAEQNGLKKNILIIGCSDGTYVLPAAKKGFKVTAIDIDYEAIYGGDKIMLNGKSVENLGLKKRLQIENDLTELIEYKLCDIMNFNSEKKYSLVFTSGSIHYESNSKYKLDNIINKMIDLLDNKGILLLEYIVRDFDTEVNRHFVTKSEINETLEKRRDVTVLSHKIKEYIEEANVRDKKEHKIKWGRLYLKKENMLQEKK